MAKCVKTGCIAHIVEQNYYVRGDLYLEDDVYILYGLSFYESVEPPNLDFIIDRVGFHKATKPFAIWIAPARHCQVTPRLAMYWRT